MRSTTSIRVSRSRNKNPLPAAISICPVRKKRCQCRMCSRTALIRSASSARWRRVYISIGSFHQEWLKHFNLLVGGKRQTPIAITVVRRNSAHFRATLSRLADVAAFFVAAAKPHPLAKAPGGASYMQDSEAMVLRGQQLFAENCAGCHVSYNKMPEPPSGVERATPVWDSWIQSDEFRSKMTVLVRRSDFSTIIISRRTDVIR
jgi:hypothetical protein